MAGALPRNKDRMVLYEATTAIARLFFEDLFECRTFVHGHMICFVALDQVLRFLLRGVNRIPFEFDFRGNFLLYGSLNAACLRIPFNVIAYFEIFTHQITSNLLEKSTILFNRRLNAQAVKSDSKGHNKPQLERQNFH